MYSQMNPDLIRGDHNNPNSPYFEGREIDECLLKEFVEEHLHSALYEHFFEEFPEVHTIPYECLDWEDFPEDVKEMVVTHMIEEALDFCEDKYIELEGTV